jgi:hypothetical protein
MRFLLEGKGVLSGASRRGDPKRPWRAITNSHVASRTTGKREHHP